MKKPSKPKEKTYTIRFREETEFELIKAAAARRGVSFNTFVRITSTNAARTILKDVPAEFPGASVEELESIGISGA